ncbi:MAG: hypothetical protein WB611_07910 [Stellaceae bacterium]
MVDQEMTRTRAPSARTETMSLYGMQAEVIVVELDEIVGRSRRKSRLRRAMHRFGGAFARLLERAVPAQAPAVDRGLPPELKYPIF